MRKIKRNSVFRLAVFQRLEIYCFVISLPLKSLEYRIEGGGLFLSHTDYNTVEFSRRISQLVKKLGSENSHDTPGAERDIRALLGLGSVIHSH